MFSRISLFRKILLVMLIVTLLPLGFTAYRIIERSKTELGSTLREEKYTPYAQRVTLTIEKEYFSHWRSILEFIRIYIDQLDSPQQDISLEISAIMDTYPEILLLVIYDHQQQSRIAALNENLQHYFYEDELLYEKYLPDLFAHDDPRFFIAPPYYSEANSVSLLNLGLRCQNGQTVRIIVDLSNLFTELNTISEDLAGSGSFLVVDNTGQMIFQSLAHSASMKTIADNPQLSNLLHSRATGSFQYTDLQGEQYLGSTSPIPSIGWTVFVTQPTSQAYLPIQAMIRNFLISLLLAVLTAVIISLFFARQLTRPIIVLQKATKSVAEGNLETTLDIKRRDEIGDLSRDFNEMIGSLREKEKIKDTWRLYTPPLVVEEMMRDLDNIKVGGEKRELAVMFMDIRGFTKMSGELEADEILTILNEIMELSVDAIFKFQGTLDKFLGDGLLAFFGAPIAHDDDCIRACQAALTMRNQITKYSREREKKGQKAIKIGIGLHFGEATVGNIGTRKRIEYTAIGDVVNVASRLCGVAKGDQIIISQQIFRQVNGLFVISDLDAVKVKGKDTPLVIYQLESEIEK